MAVIIPAGMTRKRKISGVAGHLMVITSFFSRNKYYGNIGLDGFCYVNYLVAI
jgi:hypothetical protein